MAVRGKLSVLKQMDRRHEWLICELPGEITDDTLQYLGDAGLIRVRIPILDSDRKKREYWSRWIWPDAAETVAGPWASVVEKYGRSSEFPMRIQLSAEGRRFVMQQAAQAPPSPGPKRIRENQGKLAPREKQVADALDAEYRRSKPRLDREVSESLEMSQSAFSQAKSRAEEKLLQLGLYRTWMSAPEPASSRSVDLHKAEVVHSNMPA